MNQFLVILFILSFTFFSLGQDEIEQDICSHVSVLASDEMKGRSTGSIQEKEANNYIESHWGTSKKTKTVRWSYSISLGDSAIQSEMIGSFINNKKDSSILIGAHIDHIGYGGVLSKSLNSTEIHNGADDNASGVALLIELQKSIAQLSLRYNVLFVAYTGHEIGTFGSKYLSEHLPKKASKLALVINYDMVGRMNDYGDVYLSITPGIENNFQPNSKELNIKFGDEKKLEVLDTKHFHPKIPCVTITTGMHNDYHKTTDDSEYINCQGITLIHAFTIHVLKSL
jgi:Zn-dependent M28 family amino/carboxypeptidase